MDSNRIELVEALTKAREETKVYEKDKHLFDSLIETAEQRMRQVSSSYKYRFNPQNSLISNLYQLVEKMVENYS